MANNAREKIRVSKLNAARRQLDCAIELWFADKDDVSIHTLAVVGNTGSGKSCTIAHLVHEAVGHSKLDRPHFFILDINGEYGAAFGHSITAQPNKVYINGDSFGVPLWLMNAREVCEWLSASEQTQEPVLKNVWSIAKGGAGSTPSGISNANEALERLSTHEMVAEGKRKGFTSQSPR